MDLLDWLRDTLGQSTYGAIGLAVLAFAGFAVASYVNRDKLVVGDPDVAQDEMAPMASELGRLVRSELRRASQQHLQAQGAAGDVAVFQELAPQARADEVALRVSPERFKPLLRSAMAIFGWLVRPPTLRSMLYRDPGLVGVQASLHRRGAQAIELPRVNRPPEEPALRTGIARELALKIIIAQADAIAVTDWRALDCLTRAIERWPKRSSQAARSESEEAFREVEEALTEALVHDPASPLVLYNLGLVRYSRFDGAENEEAKTLFERAARTDNPRLRALALIGSARCYCQDYHRFGQATTETLENARRAATEALGILEPLSREAEGPYARLVHSDLARAYACRAFAFHVTEDPVDIEAGKADYLRVIGETTPSVPTYVYNNLGYILMARAGRFTPGPDTATYQEAAGYLDKALERDPSNIFALANLGNIDRLMGRTEASIRRYREAVGLDPSYANGWNELAWAYLAAGQPDEAADAHAKAASLAQTNKHRSQVKAIYARALDSTGRRDEAIDAAREGLALNHENSSITQWLSEVGAAP